MKFLIFLFATSIAHPMRVARDLASQNRLLNNLELHKSGREVTADNTLPGVNRQLAGWLIGLDDDKKSRNMSTAFINTLMSAKQQNRTRRFRLFQRHHHRRV